MKIALIGYGKMGRMIEEIALSRGHEVVCIIDIDNQADFDSEAFRSAEVAIEFTAPAVAFGNVKRAMAQHVKVVSGSTGWYQHHADEMREACEGGATLLWSSNFSLGVAVFRAVNKYLAAIMNRFDAYSPQMTETHHVHKLDAPSGTAITLAEDIVSRVDRLSGWQLTDTLWLDEEGKTTHSAEPIASDKLPVVAVRHDEVPGIHNVVWESEADCISICHDAHSRRGFALGAVLAAEFTAQHSGLLSIDDLFNF